MTITKLLNNNALIALNHGKEVIIIGTGVGYKAKIGQKVDESKIQKIFSLNESSNRLLEMIKEIPDVYLEITELMISYGELKGLHFSNSIYIQMTDHIYHAVEHEKEGIRIQNDLYHMYKRYYPVEFEVARYAHRLVKDRVGFELSEDEIGFVVFHIIESTSNYNKYEIEKEIKFVNESIEFIKANCIGIIENSINYDRLIIHLKFLANRYFNNEKIESEETDEIMNEVIKKSMPEEFKMANKFSEFIKQKYGKQYSRQEINYLTIHFRNTGIK